MTANGIVLDPGNLLAWLFVGLVAGAIASRLVGGRGLGCLMDIVIGMVGAFIGGFIVSLFAHDARYGLLGSILVAVLGATVFLAFIRLLGGRRL